MRRRTFNKLVAAGLTTAGIRPRGWAAVSQNISPTERNQPTKWPDQVYRRLLVDTHIPDWDPILLSRFNAVDYVATIARAGFQCLMQYAISCAGLCLWRSKIAQMHRGMKRRDYFAEVVNECKRQGLHTVAYFHVIWDNHAYEAHPDWRYRPAGGDAEVLQGRYGYTCPNTPYRDYALALARELVTNYEFAGIFNDMILWPGVCYCSYCTGRFWKEQNAEPPRVVDWDDPTWRAFQQSRQRWMLEFAKDFTSMVKSIRPITVEHQFATVFTNWVNGVPLELGTEACDFVGGDFYGGPAQFSLVCKAFNGISRTRPFEFMTSRTNDLTDFVTIKPKDELRLESFIPSLHSAALLTIDAFNPDGTINHNVYDELGKINKQRAPFEPFLGGKLLGDVAIYFDKESMYNPDEKGVHITELKAVEKSPHFEGVLGSARILREAHIPFGLVTNATLDQLKDYRAVILPNVLELNREQAVKLRSFVEQGGVLYATGPSSLDRFDKTGPRFLLEDVLGVRYQGKIGRLVTYLTATDEELKKVIWPQNEIIFRGPMILVEASPRAEVLGTVTLPYVDPETIHVIGSHFAQIISDPPAFTPGRTPGIVVNSVGSGKAVWVSAPIESGSNGVNARVVSFLLRRVLPGPYHFEVETHPSIEMTLYDQPENHRVLAGLLNMQQDAPPIPVGATVRVKVPSGRRATTILRVPDRKPIPFERSGPYVQFRIESIRQLAMALVEYQ